jgi:hypothetical protein
MIRQRVNAELYLSEGDAMAGKIFINYRRGDDPIVQHNVILDAEQCGC